MSESSAITSLYVHVPFCAHKCEYCAFYSEATNGDVINRYVAALVREMELVAHDLKPRVRFGVPPSGVLVHSPRKPAPEPPEGGTPNLRTVFFGGGTPSILNLRQWETILRAMERLNLLGAEEWTIESNPATVSLDKAKLWRDFGVNRVSMGVQSLDEKLLDRLGRIHSREQVFKSFDTLRSAGFDNLNVDLMFAIPTQTMEVWRATLREAIALGSEHLSCYEVIYEEDTPLYAQLQAKEFDVDEELACAMYDELVQTAGGSAFVQYEVANFARETQVGRGVLTAPCGIWQLPAQVSDTRLGGVRTPRPTIPTFACRHNVNYWRGGSFYGLGPSATGYVRGVRTKNWSNTQLYCEQLERGRRAIESSEQLSPEGRAGETAAFGLRMPVGWRFDEFQHLTGFDLRENWSAEMHKFVRQGWAEVNEESFRLNATGLRFADAAAEEFLRPATGGTSYTNPILSAGSVKIQGLV